MTDTDTDALVREWTGLGLRRLVERELACTAIHDALLIVAEGAADAEDRACFGRIAGRWLGTAKAAAAEAAVELGREPGRELVAVADREGLLRTAEQLAVALLAPKLDPVYLEAFDACETDDDELRDAAVRLVNRAADAAGVPPGTWSDADAGRTLAAFPGAVAGILTAGRSGFLLQVVEDAELAHAATRDRLAAAIGRLRRVEAGQAGEAL
jgi:hypothetical protein